jgi:hypothetical protein
MMTAKTPPLTPIQTPLQDTVVLKTPPDDRATLFQQPDVINLHRVRKTKVKQERQARQKGADRILSAKKKKQSDHVIDLHQLDPKKSS